MTYAIGIDLGGTNIVAGAVRTDGDRLVGLRSEPTQAERGPAKVVKRIIALVKATQREVRRQEAGAQVIGVGVGAPGPLDTRSGVVHLTPNLGWVDMPLRDLVARGTGLPVELDNDANCAVLGEWWRGAAQGSRHALGVTIGTGIGGGIVIDGKLYHGASDCAGEIGHTTIDANGRRCKCGNYGCLEAYASGPAIARRAVEAVESGAASRLARFAGGSLDDVTAQTVYEAATAGDEVALEVVRDTAKLLGAGLANLLNLLNPEVVVVCGGVTQAGDRLFEPLRREVARRAFRPATQACRIVPGALPGSAGVYGAVRMFLDRQDG